MKTAVTISLAQIPVERGEVEYNLTSHLNMIALSSCNGADVVVFPELSLTGYELDLAEELALAPEPDNFQQLSRAAVENKIIVIVGCPLKYANTKKPAIGSVICFPDGRVSFYAKQYLHEGEQTYCSSGSSDYFFNINGHKAALAICADFVHKDHAKRAGELGADIYIASALISEGGYAPDSIILSEIAVEQRIPVLLSNHISKTGGWETCGKSTIWNPQGERIDRADIREPGIVLCTLTGRDIEVKNVIQPLVSETDKTWKYS
ncbi:TPA: carbon-nitrogen hydrolase family protein [Vibrio campbellii]